ncbi:hypothetical protein GDO78_002548 [Eleutherodactylus coqui]|uniref:Uncharacterized protein n=1 Tax=Eleutherodactylus coqui TaxID=57060 RepID=A0A8J6K2J4_ELECQ|nr:hypothetical protein GDO78_002548 [Eleutherodactylus coqui]
MVLPKKRFFQVITSIIFLLIKGWIPQLFLTRGVPWSPGLIYINTSRSSYLAGPTWRSGFIKSICSLH